MLWLILKNCSAKCRRSNVRDEWRQRIFFKVLALSLQGLFPAFLRFSAPTGQLYGVINAQILAVDFRVHFDI